MERNLPPPSARQKRQPHLPVRIIPVRIDQHYGLPGAKRELPGQYGDCRVRWKECREYVVAAVTRRAVPVVPSVVGRQ